MQCGLCLEEPDAGNPLVRVCVGAAWGNPRPYPESWKWGRHCAAPSALPFGVTVFLGLTAEAINWCLFEAW
jgi:hypothetical protein